MAEGTYVPFTGQGFRLGDELGMSSTGRDQEANAKRSSLQSVRSILAAWLQQIPVHAYSQQVIGKVEDLLVEVTIAWSAGLVEAAGAQHNMRDVETIMQKYQALQTIVSPLIGDSQEDVASAGSSGHLHPAPVPDTCIPHRYQNTGYPFEIGSRRLEDTDDYDSINSSETRSPPKKRKRAKKSF